MGFLKKEWKDRIAEYINRRTIIKADESSEVVTVERNEGTISQEGDAFNADTMNDLEDRVATAFETVPESTTVKNIELVTELPTTGTEGGVYFTYEE